MGRFVRRRSVQRAWISGLPAHFSMDELLDAAGPERMHDALHWLYGAIERGRVEPEQVDGGLRYAFRGGRRKADSDQRAADATRR